MKRWIALTAMALIGCSTDKTSETTLTWEQTPQAVRMGIEKAYPDSKVTKVQREVYTETDIVQYEVELVTKDGREMESEFSSDGELLD